MIVAYLTERTKEMTPLRTGIRFCAMLPMALPGLVVGIAYIMFFNKSEFSIFGLFKIPNATHFLYHTITLMILSNITHMFSATYITATTAIKKLDKEYENVASSMAIPPWRLFISVTLPLTIVAVIEIAMYFFVNSMITISAVVFLYNSSTKPASVSILNMEDNSDFAAASAMSMILLGMNIVMRILFETTAKLIEKRLERLKAGQIKKRGVKLETIVEPASV